MHKWQEFWQLPWTERRLLVQLLFGLPLLTLGLQWMGLKRLQATLLKWFPADQHPPQVSLQNVERQAHRITAIIQLAACSGRYGANCLPRSLMLWTLLRHYGIQSNLRIGVRKVAGQLQAHAWVEYQGMPLNDRANIQQEFAPFNTNIFPAEVRWQ